MATAQFPAKAVRIPGFGVLYLAMLIASTGNFAMMSLFPAIARSSDIPDAVMVTIQSVSAGLSLFATPYWAGKSDVVGRKPIILVGMSGFLIASMVTAAAIFIATHRLLPVAGAVACLIFSRALFGCFGLASAPAIQAHVADQTSAAERTRAVASIFSANGLGAILGPAIAPLLILPVLGLAGPQAVFSLAGAAALALIALRLPARPPAASRAAHAPVRKLEVLGRASVWPFVAYMTILSGCQAANLQMIGFVVIDVTRLPPVLAQSKSGIALMAGALAAVTIQLGLLRVLRLRPPALMVCGIALAVAGNLLMAAAHDFPSVVLAFVVSSAGYGFSAPAAAAGASIANPGAQQGIVIGLVTAAAASGLLLFPLLAMLLYHHGPAEAFVAIAICLTLLAILIVPRCARRLA